MRLDLTEDLDADSSGQSPSDSAFDSIDSIADPLEVTVPEGTYRFEYSQTFDRREDLGLVAAPGATVRFIPPEGFSDEWLRFECDTLIEGITIDRNDTGTSPTVTLASPRKALLDRVTIEGPDDVPEQGSPIFSIGMENPRSDAVFRNLQIPARSGSITSTTDGRAGIGADPLNEATITLEDCLIEECSGPGVNAARSNGDLQIEDGIFRNNSQTQINVSQPDSVIDRATVEVDPASAVSGTTGDYDRLSGIDVGAPASTGRASGRITDCEIAVRSGDSTLVDAAIYGTDKARRTEIDGTDITVNADDVPAICFRSPVIDSPDPAIEYEVDIDDVLCKGSSRSGDTIVIEGRSDTEIHRTCIETPGVRQGYRFTPKAPVKANLRKIETPASCEFFRGPLREQ